MFLSSLVPKGQRRGVLWAVPVEKRVELPARRSHSSVRPFVPAFRYFLLFIDSLSRTHTPTNQITCKLSQSWLPQTYCLDFQSPVFGPPSLESPRDVSLYEADKLFHKTTPVWHLSPSVCHCHVEPLDLTPVRFFFISLHSFWESLTPKPSPWITICCITSMWVLILFLDYVLQYKGISDCGQNP